MAKVLYFLAIMLAAIALGAGLAHLFELPNKIGLGAQDYLTGQRNYDNWWIVGLVVPLAFLAVLASTIALRGTGAPFVLALVALVLLIGELARRLHRSAAPSPRRRLAKQATSWAAFLDVSITSPSWGGPARFCALGWGACAQPTKPTH